MKHPVKSSSNLENLKAEESSPIPWDLIRIYKNHTLTSFSIELTLIESSS